MGSELGRISGPLLSANLLRNGVDLAFETSLLYLDVSNGRIGINTDVPTRDLVISASTSTTNLIVDTQFDIPNFTFSNNVIQNYDASAIYIRPNQLLDPKIVTTRVGTLNLHISDKLIENITLDSHIELSPDGAGKVLFDTTVLNITGNLHSTNNITADGSVVIGNNDKDSAFFNSDIKSDLIPNVTNAYNLGSSLKQWNNLYTQNTVVKSITTGELVVNNIDYLLTPGNTLYVSKNGNDSNYGNHLRSPFKTIKHALSVAQPGDQIFIFSGTYEEVFPLTVPQGVSISGESLRSVTVAPTDTTKFKDAFLLNGETTVENIAVRDFYYDSDNNTGYGFRLANNTRVTIRSPYIRNVTVITTGTHSNTGVPLDGGAALQPLFDAILDGGVAASSYLDSITGGLAALDGLGFEAGNAGRGALVDGSAVSSESKEASMLFHSVTLIVPNADGITVTNGARVEWLNSFTYFANRGIHLTDGTLGFASIGERFGAEMRSINSANVYGNYGAIANGPNTLGYLIGHNFGYIGTGANSYNDPRLAIQANEVQELNEGRIYYDSVDHKGDYRIGSIFYINQETGDVVFDASAIDFGAEGSIVLEGLNGGTTINNLLVQTGNIRIYDNNIDSLSGPVNFFAAAGSTYLNTNVFVTGNAGVTGDVLVKGDFQLGNQTSDVIIIAPELSQHINPATTNAYDLGTSTKRWNTLYNNLLDIDGITQISNNIITTLTTSTDLELIANGTGILHVAANNVAIDNSLTIDKTLTVNGTSSLKNSEIIGNITLVGDLNQTGSTSITGTFANHNIKISGNSYFLVPSIKIYNNAISAEATNDDLIFNAATTGGVILDQRIKFTENTISNVWSGATTDTQKSIIFSPNGTGNVELNSTKSLNLPVGSNAVRTLSQTGEIRYNSIFNTFEGRQPSGLVSLNNIFDTDKNTYITAELTPGANDNIIRFGINGAVKATVSSSRLYDNTAHLGNISVSGNSIRNLISTTDFELAVSGTGVVNINDTLLVENTITNTKDTALVLASTGIGYVKFAGSKALVIPTGSSTNRREAPEIGEIRHNTTLGYMEVYCGDPLQGDNGWIPSTGTSGSATLSVVEDIMDIWSLILG